VTTMRKERGEPDTDLARALWRKSTSSGGNGRCVEIADLSAAAAVRDSKDPDGPTLVLPSTNGAASPTASRPVTTASSGYGDGAAC
jgi:hypothetical protein